VTTQANFIQELIKLYDLQPHPEGGYFRETYRATGVIPQTSLPAEFTGNRSFCTAIYFLLTAGQKSCLHQIKSDEIWHFYLGDPLVLWQMHPDHGAEKIVLGQNIRQGEKLQHVVPAGWWFGAYPDINSQYSFVGCTVAPGFDFADFTIGGRSHLLQLFPEYGEIIKQLTDA
jgi:predicted cupin superfamily sugar epimerase